MSKLLLAYSSTNPAFGTVFRISLPLHFKIFQPPSGGSAHAGLGLIRASAFTRRSRDQTIDQTAEGRKQPNGDGSRHNERIRRRRIFERLWARRDISKCRFEGQMKLHLLSTSSVDYWRTLHVHISDVMGQKEIRRGIESRLRALMARAGKSCSVSFAYATVK